MLLGEELIVSLLSVRCVGSHSPQEELETDAAECCFSALAGVEGQEWLQEQQPMHLGDSTGFVTDGRVVSLQRVGESREQRQI